MGGLTCLQLAADILETATAPTSMKIRRVGAIAVIRTFLNYFLERDLAAVERHAAGDHEAVDTSPSNTLASPTLSGINALCRRRSLDDDRDRVED